MSQSKIKKLRKQQALKTRLRENLSLSNTSLIQIIKDNWKFLVIICLYVFGLFLNSLNGDFVSDDYGSITTNPLVGDFGTMLKNTPWFLNGLTYRLFGYGSPFPYHLLSLLIYLVAIVLVYVFVEKIFEDRFLSMVSTSLFAVLPVHVEAVSWISGRIYMILAIYIVLGLLLFVRMIETKKWIYGAGTGFLFLLAFMTDKPRPVSLIFLIILYLYYFKDRFNKINFGKIFWYGSLTIGLFFVVAYPAIISRINIVNSGYKGDGGVFYNPFFQYPTGISKYLQILLVPLDLTLYHTMYVFPVWLNWLILILFLSILVWGFVKDKRYFFAIMFFLLSLAPSMAPVKVSWLVAERYVFLPSLGFCVLLGLFLGDLYKIFKMVVPVFLVCLLVFYSTIVFLRNIDWQTNHNLWVATVQTSPNSHNAWNNIGDDYDKLGQYENAIKGFSQSVVYKPNYADAYHNRANIYFKTGYFDLARESYETALSYNPALMQTYISLTQIDLTEDKIDLALQHSTKAIEIDPYSPQAWYVSGVVYAEANQTDKAIEAFKKSLQIAPNFQLSRDALNKLYQEKGL